MPDEETAATVTTVTSEQTETKSEEKDWKAEAEKAAAAASKWEARAKGNHNAVKELETLKRTAMTDLEKAVEDARNEGRAIATKEAAAALVDARIEAAATGRLSPEQVTNLLDGIDRSRFVDEDGRVDASKITKFVDAVAPVKGAPDFGQGQRGNAGPSDFNAAIRNKMRR